jgi:hypothetical protein
MVYKLLLVITTEGWDWVYELKGVQNVAVLFLVAGRVQQLPFKLQVNTQSNMDR